MKKLAILVPNGDSKLSSLSLALEILDKANELYTQAGKQPVFEVMLVGNAPNNIVKASPFTVQLDYSTADGIDADLIIVPGLASDIEKTLKQNTENIEWVIRQYKNGAEVASLCTGAFILAQAGLLNGKLCSTHWQSADLFMRLFPKVNLAIDKIITEEHGVYTTGAALLSTRLVLHIVEKYYGRDITLMCSKLLAVDLDRSSQSDFIIFSGQKNHHDEAIKQAQLFMENNVGERIAIDDLSSKLMIDRRTFDRRFKKATGNTPLEYMQRVKVEAAKRLFETSRKTVNEVMYDVGYMDVKAFREVFKKITGLSPIEYRAKYNKDAMMA